MQKSIHPDAVFRVRRGNKKTRTYTHTPAFLYMYVYKNKHIKKNKTEDKVD